MVVSKSGVVSVRVQPRIKAALQTAAEREMRGVANKVEVMLLACCQANQYPLAGVPDETLLAARLRQSPL